MPFNLSSDELVEHDGNLALGFSKEFVKTAKDLIVHSFNQNEDLNGVASSIVEILKQANEQITHCVCLIQPCKVECGVATTDSDKLFFTFKKDSYEYAISIHAS